MNVSVIVTTYNRPETLLLVLKSLLDQTVPPFEIVIADDGSTEETKSLIDEFSKTADVNIIHAWQEDKGFRAAKVRNLAISMCKAKEYIVFLDGDCVPLKHFIERYISLAEQGWFCTGSRILFSEKITGRIIKESININDWKWSSWLLARLSGDIKRLLPLLYLGEGKWRYSSADNWKKLRSCNMGIFYSDIKKVNGFDEIYTGWGREDSDFAVRLINAEIKRKDARFSVPVMHMWHQENDRSNLNENTQLLNSVISSKRIIAEKGLDQYL